LSARNLTSALREIFGFTHRAGPGASCYVNCDESTSAPVANVLDLACFINAFAAGAGYANCDGSTIQPTLNVLEFGCVINRLAAGCN
jgi:hypothetical protein